MDFPDIRSLLPHSGTMVLLDRVVAADADSLCAEVAIRPDSLFCNADGVGAWVGIEYMAQAIAAHAGYLARLRGDAVKVVVRAEKVVVTPECTPTMSASMPKRPLT